MAALFGDVANFFFMLNNEANNRDWEVLNNHD